MRTVFSVENIKCSGCAGGVDKAVRKLPGVKNVCVDIEQGAVTIEHSTEFDQKKAAGLLFDMGYPEAGTLQGLDHLKAKAVSFVSCAIGKVDQKRSA